MSYFQPYSGPVVLGPGGGLSRIRIGSPKNERDWDPFWVPFEKSEITGPQTTNSTRFASPRFDGNLDRQ